MKMIKVLWIVVFSVLVITACGRQESFKDLRQYIASLGKNNATNKNKSDNLTIPRFIPAIYKKESSRTPFEEMMMAHGQAASSPNPVRMYPLNLLRFVGTMEQNNHIWAYVMTPDNKLYQLTKGDIVGDHNGTIVKITANEIEVVEPVVGDGKQGAQRIVTMQLRDETNNE